MHHKLSMVLINESSNRTLFTVRWTNVCCMWQTMPNRIPDVDVVATSPVAVNHTFNAMPP